VSALTNPQDAHFWIFIALVVFAIILWRAKVPGMAMKALDDAGAKIQAQLDEATLLREEAKALLAQINVQREETEKAAAEMLAAAQADAERLRAEAAVTLEEDVRRMRDLAVRKIAVAEAAAAAEVKAAAADPRRPSRRNHPRRPHRRRDIRPAHRHGSGQAGRRVPVGPAGELKGFTPLLHRPNPLPVGRRAKPPPPSTSAAASAPPVSRPAGAAVRGRGRP